MFRYQHTNGDPVETNVCVRPDHNVTTFTVQIRSINTPDATIIKQLLQQKFEVVGLPQKVDHLIVVK